MGFSYARYNVKTLDSGGCWNKLFRIIYSCKTKIPKLTWGVIGKWLIKWPSSGCSAWAPRWPAARAATTNTSVPHLHLLINWWGFLLMDEHYQSLFHTFIPMTYIFLTSHLIGWPAAWNLWSIPWDYFYLSQKNQDDDCLYPHRFMGGVVVPCSSQFLNFSAQKILG